ncbi:hypothetical protein OQY15_04660 [Pedobacter sp. MC2016-15]|uniref:sacsin N-terminal ATP-binding-like domain-containing protein n=1 Tax=Pedobacter sp. MC2016-15 TaxID=2994473 RepID=UPI00224785C9|nr:DUF3883 domain-containing protein [Pedobacter sp. MC2016-15]MCX2478369.1 hypothetical protein [Pedobacter sp. MC2016-15]
MNQKNFIENLTQKNADYNNPEQAITTANLCETISRDINTDSQRFIYELLQNADDASNLVGKLDVCIDFVGNYVIVSHNGESFSEIDIESISSAGDGTKTGDTNKTGFKGIGFKSVFAHSSFVIIKSEGFNFKFEKEYWENHWSSAWGTLSDWQIERKSKNKDENLKMPWQIIPIWTQIPDELKHLKSIQEYSVSTIIRHDKIGQLKKSLDELFSESQIVLFLRSKNVKIIINTSEKFVLEKNIIDETTILRRNGVVLSEWIIKTEEFNIPIDVQGKINADEKSPKKLKEAEHTEISFAIQLERGKLKSVVKQNRLIFTYLPTSINYDFPFLVNASFLTDAGRQHLHQDTFWNNWLFKQIPIIFFRWVSELAHKNSKYNKQFLTVIPHKLGSSPLEDSFNEGFKIALETISFIPNLNGDLLRIKETLYDKTKISRFIAPQTLIKYINQNKGKQFTVSSLVPYLEPISTLSRLGTVFFDIDDLGDFFKSKIFSDEHELEENFKLICFLHEQTKKNNGEEDKNIWNEKMKQLTFIFDETKTLRKPNHIYFPAVEFSNEFSDEISIIHESVVSEIYSDNSIKSWLEYLGVKEPTDVSFIEKTIIDQGQTFVTRDNAINIGRYLFNAHKKGNLEEHHYEKLGKLQVLTKEKSLINASDSFLADFYEPLLKIESVYNNDFYISEEYVVDGDSKREWGNFLVKVGVKDDIDVTYSNIELDFDNRWKERFDATLLELVRYTSTKFSWISNSGWTIDRSGYGFYPSSIGVHILPFLDLTTNYDFSKLFFHRVFTNLTPDDLQINLDFGVNGSTGFYKRYLSSEQLKSQNCPSNYFQWILENVSIFPTLNKKCYKATEVFANTADIKALGGKYIPVLDYDQTLSPEWRDALNFKYHLTLDTYLEILSKIWQDTDLSESEQIENKARVGVIYDKLSQIELHETDKDKISGWALKNKLLANNGKDFYNPNELSIVVEEGFNASSIIYVRKSNSEILELLRLFGVRIIDKVIPSISNSKVEIQDLKTKILQITPLIALVAVEKSRNKKEWEIEFERINKKLSNIRFFETEEIFLSYGNEADKQRRSSWAEDDNFYYVGKWFSPRVLDGLVGPLGKFFSIRYAERILTVLLLETFEGGLEYLREKGYEISLIPNELMSPSYQEVVLLNQSNRVYNQIDEDLGKQGEIFVFKELKRIYSNKYNQPIQDTLTGFKIDDKIEVFWRNISGTTTTDHDFKIVDLGDQIYIDSKATAYDKNVEKLALYISGNELSLMEAADKFLIARVYNATSEKPTMELVKLEKYDLMK